MTKRFDRLVSIPTLITLGVVFGLSFAMTNPPYQLVAMTVVIGLTVWLTLEFILQLMTALLFPVFDLAADRLIEFYNSIRPLRPTIKEKIEVDRAAYWQKKVERQRRRERENAKD